MGDRVVASDHLVGEVSPKSQSELPPEENLLHALSGRAGEDVKNDSLEVPAGTEGIVIGAKRFSRRTHQSEDQKKQLKKDITAYEASMDRKIVDLFRQMAAVINRLTGSERVDPNPRQTVAGSDIPDFIMEQVDGFRYMCI